MSYHPDKDAEPRETLFTRQLSQRDLSLSIPVNFVEHAGVSLTAACFANNRYVAEAAQRCFSNLLAIGFRRYEVDVYWDVRRQLWSLCPVEIAARNVSSQEFSITSSPSVAAALGQQTDLSLLALTSETDTGFLPLVQRQATTIGSSPESASSPPTSVSATTESPTEASASTTSPFAATTSNATTEDGIPESAEYQQIGPYLCSASADLDWLSRIMWTYLETTETNLNATLRYLILNLHAAASSSDPTGPAEEPSTGDLPDANDLLSSVLVSNLSTFLYTPANLRDQRGHINNTWYDVPLGLDSTPGYYTVSGPSDKTSTPDGWPSENYVELQEGKRLFVGFGTVDPQLQEYNVSQDTDSIFPQGYLQAVEELSLSTAGDTTSGCFYQPREFSVSSVNNSWAFAVDPSLTDPNILYSSSNITRCGVSPILNVTLQNGTADQDFLPYQTYLQSSIWSWAAGYPRLKNDTAEDNTEDKGNADADDETNLSTQPRCAALNSSSGFWQNIACDSLHYSACRRDGAIYDWSISSDDTTYTKAGLSCPDGHEFDVPRTGLQNQYLVNTWRTFRSNHAREDSISDDEMLWLNFNNLDSKLCWVVGQNQTCPYINRRNDKRQVVVPIVAAVIVFAIGVLTVFVKCAANRQSNKRQKRRKRGDDGWDYEGVPS